MIRIANYYDPKTDSFDMNAYLEALCKTTFAIVKNENQNENTQEAE